MRNDHMKVVCDCDNCRRPIYECDRRYWIRLDRDAYCLCDRCVTVIETPYSSGHLPDYRPFLQKNIKQE